jgi:hypothetical protein
MYKVCKFFHHYWRCVRKLLPHSAQLDLVETGVGIRRYFFYVPIVNRRFFFSRLLGLIGFVETKCDNPQALDYRSEDLDWPHFVFVAVVVTLYWFLATEIRYDNNDQV